MPVFLLHGFRWPRALIRIHIILQNLDNACADWIVAKDSKEDLYENFEELHPTLMPHLPNLRFVEQYDPADGTCQPFAYIADICHEINLSESVDEIMQAAVPSEQVAAMTELRDKTAADQKLGWFVVVCADEDRLDGAEPLDLSDMEDTVEGEEEEGDGATTPTAVPIKPVDPTHTPAAPAGLTSAHPSAPLAFSETVSSSGLVGVDPSASTGPPASAHVGSAAGKSVGTAKVPPDQPSSVREDLWQPRIVK